MRAVRHDLDCAVHICATNPGTSAAILDLADLERTILVAHNVKRFVAQRTGDHKRVEVIKVVVKLATFLLDRSAPSMWPKMKSKLSPIIQPF
jgi:hypothetical protein